MEILKTGSTGVDVKILQRQLISMGYKLVISGDFDADTDAAVRHVQAANNLSQDGEVGDATHRPIDFAAPILVDISHNDGVIDWENADPRVQGVYSKAAQGKLFRDPLFITDISAARERGLYYSPYHFLTAADAAADQASNYLTMCEAARIDWTAPGCLPPMVDVEDQVPASLNKLITADKGAFVEKVNDFISIVAKETGRRLVLYSYRDFFSSYLNNAVFDADLWLAAYQTPAPRLPNGYSRIAMWQWGENVYPAGFPSCDIDLFIGNASQLAKYGNK